MTSIASPRAGLLHRLRRALLALALLPLAFGVVVLLASYVVDKKDDLELSYKRRAARLAEMLELYVGRAREHLGQTQTFWNYEALPSSDKLRILQDIVATNEEFLSIHYLSARGDTRLRAARRDVMEGHERAWRDEETVRQAIATHEVSFGQVVVDAQTAEPALVMAMPVQEPGRGKVVGLLAAELTFKPVWRELSRLSQGTPDDAFVLSADQRIVAHINPSVALAGTRYVPPQASGIHRDLRGRLALVVVRQVKLPGNTLTVVLTRPLASAYGVVLVAVGSGLATLLVTIVLSLLLVRRMERWLIRPIGALTEAAERIRHNESGVRVAGRFEGEVALLAETFNLMLDRLHTEQLALEQRVQQRTSELSTTTSMLQTVLDTAPYAIFWKDLEGRYLGCNRRFAIDAAMRSPVDVVGLTDHDLPWVESADLYREDDAAVVASGQAKLDFEELMVLSDGTRRWLSTSKVPLRDLTGQVLGVLGSYEDITVRKHAQEQLEGAKEEAERANVAKSEFLSRMSHELRTPLNAILGFAQMLALTGKSQLTEQQADNVQEILKAGRHLLVQVNEILDLARIESGRIEVSLEPLPLAPLVADCIAQLGPLAAARDITMAAPIDKALGIQGDATRVRQVIVNLLSNAIKYNRDGGQVHVTAHPTGHCLRVEIRDTGRGISLRLRERLFRPFERLESPYDGIEGTGIGLALVKRLVEAMGGEVGVDSEEGVGSTFWFVLPSAELESRRAMVLGSSADSGPTDRLLASAADGGAQDLRRVLYIEDNPANLRLVQKLLAQRADLTLLSATSAEKGLELVRRQPPALILLDLNLPGMDGFAALAELQADPATRSIPVIAVTANAMKRDVDRGKAAGFAEYLTKPLDIGRFFQVISHYLPDTQEGTE